ncbi:MAG: hypothetical protein JXB88_05560 [Spirochaetales bacterium]|nr:hypothetical protein [Spirochaetales bacterium]
MEIINNEFSMKRNDDVKKIEKTGQKKSSLTPDISSGSFIKDTNNNYNEVTSRVQRSLTKEQIVLAGLETIYSFLESGMTKDESISLLNEIVFKTQFDNEKVLSEYEQLLETALKKGDSASIDKLIKETQDTIQTLIQELEMNEMKKQNLRSLKSISREDNAEELMQKVIKSLKEEGLPVMNIPRERVADLLGE